MRTDDEIDEEMCAALRQDMKRWMRELKHPVGKHWRDAVWLANGLREPGYAGRRVYQEVLGLDALFIYLSLHHERPVPRVWLELAVGDTVIEVTAEGEIRWAVVHPPDKHKVELRRGMLVCHMSLADIVPTARPRTWRA